MTTKPQKQPINNLSRRKKPLAFLLCLFVVGFGYGQNLVPNYSFEQFDTCPSLQDQVQYSSGWKKYSATISTPDYYNACAPSDGMDVPKSDFNNQEAHRNCSAYTALIIWGSSGNDREHIGIQLNQHMVIGQKYFLSFYTVMTESYYAGTQFGLPSNNIGMRLSTVEYNPNTPTPIDNFAHLNLSTVMSDSVNWLRISGSIVADSAYSYVILGNFFDDSNTDTMQYNCGSCINVQSYYLFDDICISQDSLLCNGGIDVLPCTASVQELVNDKVSIFPNPSADDLIKVTFLDIEVEEISLTDVFGKIVYTEKVDAKGDINLNLSPYSSGIFFLKAVDKKGKALVNKKIVKL